MGRAECGSVRTLAAIVLALALAAGAAGADSGTLHSRLAGAFRVPGVVAGDSTAMVVSLPSGRVVFARNADLSLEPASNEKLSVTYAALVELGAAYRFPTALLGQGGRVGDTWEGRLILKGFGDPSLTSSDLHRLVNILWREGIRHVTGGVAADESAFDTKRTAPGWLPSFAGNESPPLSALIVDRGAVGNRLVADPALAAARRFDRLLHQRGITARGAIVHKAGLQAVTLATIYSDPLSQILQFMDHWSDNFTAEMVLKAIGLRGRRPRHHGGRRGRRPARPAQGRGAGRRRAYRRRFGPLPRRPGDGPGARHPARTHLERPHDAKGRLELTRHRRASRARSKTGCSTTPGTASSGVRRGRPTSPPHSRATSGPASRS